MNRVCSQGIGRRFERNGRKLGGIVKKRAQSRSQSRSDCNSPYGALSIDRRKSQRRSEIDDDAGAAETAIRFDRVAYDVASDLMYGAFGNFYGERCVHVGPDDERLFTDDVLRDVYEGAG